MENIFLVKIQTNVNQRNPVHENFLSEVSDTINIRNFDHQNWMIFFVQEPIFLSRLNRFLDFWVFK